MNARARRSLIGLLLTAVALVVSATPVLGQEEGPTVTVAAIKAGIVDGEVSLQGAALAREDDGGYWFSDGTDVVRIDVGTDSGVAELPLLRLIGIEGAVAGDGIDVSSWSELEIMVPAVIRTPQEAIDAFWSWIITQNSQEIIAPSG